jgi:hypothetical protein
MCTRVNKPPGCGGCAARSSGQGQRLQHVRARGCAGPISIGKASIAAISPDSDYYFFVATSKNSRTHAFARSASEHERNVQKYVQSDP